MAAKENEIGRCRCPVCESPTAHLRVSQKQLAYVICNTCQSQTMARSDRSDELLRGRLVAEPAAAPIAAPVATTPAPAPAPALPKPAAAAPIAPPAPAAMAWGFLSR